MSCGYPVRFVLALLVLASAIAALAAPRQTITPLSTTHPKGQGVPPTLSVHVGFETRTFKGETADLPYRLLRPLNEKESNEPFPMVLVLHGVSERGKDNARQLYNGVGEVFIDKDNRAKHPAFVVVPQCPSTDQWVHVNWQQPTHTMTEEPTEPMRMTVALVESLKKELRVDANRVYVTGMGSGGFGTWDIICRRPDLFAAAVPVSGGGDANQAAAISKIAIWAWHGKLDGTVNPAWSKNMVDAVNKAGGNAKLTELDDVGHETAWAKAFANPDLLEWLFSQKRSPLAASQPASGPASQPTTKIPGGPAPKPAVKTPGQTIPKPE